MPQSPPINSLLITTLVSNVNCASLRVRSEPSVQTEHSISLHATRTTTASSSAGSPNWGSRTPTAKKLLIYRGRAPPPEQHQKVRTPPFGRDLKQPTPHT